MTTTEPTDTRSFRIIWKREDKGTQGVHFPGPLTHEEACRCLAAITPQRACHAVIQELTHGEASEGNLEKIKSAALFLSEAMGEEARDPEHRIDKPSDQTANAYGAFLLTDAADPHRTLSDILAMATGAYSACTTLEEFQSVRFNLDRAKEILANREGAR